jgi:hypothetical protein
VLSGLAPRRLSAPLELRGLLACGLAVPADQLAAISCQKKQLRAVWDGGTSQPQLRSDLSQGDLPFLSARRRVRVIKEVDGRSGMLDPYFVGLKVASPVIGP